MEYTKEKKSHKFIIMAVVSAIIFVGIDVALISNFIHILTNM